MAKFLSKTLQFCGTRLRRSSVLLRQKENQNGHETGGRRTLATALFRRDSQSCQLHASRQRHTVPRLWRWDSSSTIISDSTHSFHTGSPVFSSEGARRGEEEPGGCLTTENLLEAWFNEVPTFGTVRLRSVPFDLHIQPLNPMEHPELNKSIVKLYYAPAAGTGTGSTSSSSGSSSAPPVGYKLSEMGKLCNAKVIVEGGRLDVSCDVPRGVRLPLVCVITVPFKFDVDIEGSEDGGNVTIRGLECDRVSVHLKQGDCHLTSVKTGSVTVQCDDGSIVSEKQLLGAIDLRCGTDGSITAGRLQGVSVNCATEAGDIDIKTVYADKSTCHSQSGNVHVRDCHGDTTASTGRGNLTVDSLDGKLSAELGSGTADVYVTRHEGVHLRSEKGDIIVRFSEDGSSSLDLDAAAIEQDESLPTELNDQGKGFLRAETEHTVRASAPQGRISLKKQDWVSAIKLQFGNPSP